MLSLKGGKGMHRLARIIKTRLCEKERFAQLFLILAVVKHYGTGESAVGVGEIDLRAHPSE